MGFINEIDYEVSISDFMSMRRDAVQCDELSDESRQAYKTEDGLMTVALEGTCIGGENNLDLVCKEFCRGWYDSGNLIIANDCIMPVDITGFRISDSERFSIFDPEKHRYRDLYHSGVVDELPMKLKTYERVKIPVFFHPKYEELEDGIAGTFDARSGDRFGAAVDIFPGIPINNCKQEGENECDSEILLTGELLCPPKDYDYEWMHNKGYVDSSFDSKIITNNNFPVFKNKSIYSRFNKFSYDFGGEISTPAKAHDALLGAAEGYSYYITGATIQDGDVLVSRVEKNGDYGLAGASILFKEMIADKINRGKNTSYNSLIEEDFQFISNPVVGLEDVFDVESDYFDSSPKYFYNDNGILYKGIIIQNIAFQIINTSETEVPFYERVEGGLVCKDKVMFYAFEGNIASIFLADKGDFIDGTAIDINL